MHGRTRPIHFGSALLELLAKAEMFSIIDRETSEETWHEVPHGEDEADDHL
jgi:hypothetical protein